jgi:hypothetical protein
MSRSLVGIYSSMNNDDGPVMLFRAPVGALRKKVSGCVPLRSVLAIEAVRPGPGVPGVPNRKEALLPSCKEHAALATG